jgi:putative ABC transport system ATP-binding protein
MLEAIGLSKTYGSGDTQVHAVRKVDLRVEAGSLTVVVGRSGSGKTTLLNLLGGLEQPTAGVVRLDGTEITQIADDERALVRRDRIGFIFQAFGLLPMLTASENVEVPLRLAMTDPSERRERSRTLLDLVDLGRRAGHRPHELSGGEQQRVAIARALANRPQLLLADEPTGQLDSRTGADIIRVIAALVESEGIAVLMATHDPAPMALADQVVSLGDGWVTHVAHHQEAAGIDRRARPH